jgi:nitroreductase
MTFHNPRKADHPASQMFVDRWSPRAYTGEDIPDADLHRIFEAARWAPSAYNSQPWRFVYAKRGTPEFDKFVDILFEGNRGWAKHASVLMFLLSRTVLRPPGGDKDVPARAHSLDAGAAWAYLALEASILGWPAHAMVGLDFDKARTVLNVPQEFHIETAIALGKRGDKARLPEALAAREAPNPRNPVSSFAFAGGFPQA